MRQIPVGIYDGEIYLAEMEGEKPHVGIDNKPVFCVLRTVSESQLEYLRDISEREDEYKDLWKEAVHADQTEQGFDDWLDDVWAEEYDEDDPEDFPGKDSSWLDDLSEEDRAAADEFLEGQGYSIGTWEASGCYDPMHGTYHSADGRWYSDFKDWDFVFDNPEARKIAEDFVKKFVK